ncbi:3-ketoacyl-CoA synthase 6 isoform X2 [Amborella trichopoda]|uniref:3-ketoacyl-CoA synthase 6 isoform X2 n=1 Tax=Amborella trichopoda TaxID=13333 RepID=UPI0009BD0DFA|nr:3-ketoacyl-CoA synthase 6 isoform X2 [Amborella trichopoda]|eukprot:XP_020532130.1 3-ketoacyl-CoA synthase 6 isoform X2 [Amborella trichopoda]
MPASQNMPNSQSSVSHKYVKLGYQYIVNHLLTFLLVPIMAAAAIELFRLGPEEILRQCDSLRLDLVQILCLSLFIVFMASLYFISKPRPIYLVDYTCYKPPDSCRVPRSLFLEHISLSPCFDPESVKFQVRILERSGLGERTCVTPSLFYIPPDPTMADARADVELVIFSAVDALFKRTGIKPEEVDILIVNCTVFSPTPSLSDMVIKKFKMMSNIKSFNLSGMGCSANPLAVDLARHLLQEEDLQQNVGMSLSKDLMVIAGEALKSNITTMGPLVLPASEQLLFLLSLIGRKIFNLKLKPYIPDFKQAFEHFCVHAGGRAVIDELEKNLQLPPEHVEASRMTLHRFGNTSSSSLWYEMNYIEAKGRMKKGDRVWQIAFGSGFKCNSAVWKCNRSIKVGTDGPWADCIDQYPVHIPEVVKLQQL